ncbi:hypothetical protein LJY25_05540 [Hymenobacter sp. BT175]|uniref:hypothetical protein n=1 Tax=Hymenobacter translucens TaxID=2886507 RepID=UPI001D0EC6FA|nr:hypothetical protein [Hymenobacter translucens]MCC2545899.1 hypothetical protein [Hymenobacter translucens]
MLPFIRRHPLLLVFLLALGLVLGNGFIILVNHSSTFSSDEAVYLRMARGDFDVYVSYRYRVVLPLLARALAELMTGLGSWRNPGSPVPVGSAFWLLNSTLLALAGVCIYRAARKLGARVAPALLGMAAVLSSGVVSYLAGLALLDSASVLVVSALYYACCARHGRVLLLVALLGPVLKESLLLFMPLVLLHGAFVPWRYRLPALAGGMLLLAGVHGLLDYLAPATNLAVLFPQPLALLRNIRDATAALLTPRGLLTLLMEYGVFTLVLAAGFWGGRSAMQTWLPRLHPAAIGLLLIVLLHMLLSGDISRMALLSAPVFGTAVALILDRHPLFAGLFDLLANARLKSETP